MPRAAFSHSLLKLTPTPMLSPHGLPRALLPLLLTLVLFNFARAARFTGSVLKQQDTVPQLNTDFGWNYLGRFAFDNSGTARFNGVFDVGGAGGKSQVAGLKHFIVFYRDGDGVDGWPSVYNAKMSCLNKVVFSRFQATLQVGASTIYDFTVRSATRASYWYAFPLLPRFIFVTFCAGTLYTSPAMPPC